MRNGTWNAPGHSRRPAARRHPPVRRSAPAGRSGIQRGASYGCVRRHRIELRRRGCAAQHPAAQRKRVAAAATTSAPLRPATTSRLASGSFGLATSASDRPVDRRQRQCRPGRRGRLPPAPRCPRPAAPGHRKPDAPKIRQLAEPGSHDRRPPSALRCSGLAASMNGSTSRCRIFSSNNGYGSRDRSRRGGSRAIVSVSVDLSDTVAQSSPLSGSLHSCV